MKRAKRKEPVFVDSFEYHGTAIKIERSVGRSGDVYSAHYRDSLNNECQLMPFWDLEKCRVAVKDLIDGRFN